MFDFQGTPHDLSHIRERHGVYWQKHLDWEMVKKEWKERWKSHLSAGGRSTLHFTPDRWEMMARDAKWWGIDTVWDFSTISNNDLFSGAARCQVITFLRWKWTIFWHKQRCVSRQPGLAIRSPHQGIPTEDPHHHHPPQTKRPPQRPGSVCYHRPHDPRPPRTNNSLILCTSADLIVSLWRESPELHSVKWQMVRPPRAGRTSRLHRGASGRSPAPLPFPRRHHGKIQPATSSDSLNTSLVSPCVPTAAADACAGVSSLADGQSVF